VGRLARVSLTELSPSPDEVDSSTRITDWTSQGELSYPFHWPTKEDGHSAVEVYEPTLS